MIYVCEKYWWQKKWRKTLDFIIYWKKYSCILWFFWNWIYFSKNVKQKHRLINYSQYIYNTVWWFFYVCIVLNCFHRIYTFSKNCITWYLHDICFKNCITWYLFYLNDYKKNGKIPCKHFKDNYVTSWV